jgi:hypothetical protein
MAAKQATICHGGLPAAKRIFLHLPSDLQSSQADTRELFSTGGVFARLVTGAPSHPQQWCLQHQQALPERLDL